MIPPDSCYRIEHDLPAFLTCFLSLLLLMLCFLLLEFRYELMQKRRGTRRLKEVGRTEEAGAATKGLWIEASCILCSCVFSCVCGRCFWRRDAETSLNGKVADRVMLWLGTCETLYDEDRPDGERSDGNLSGVAQQEGKERGCWRLDFRHVDIVQIFPWCCICCQQQLFFVK